MEPKIQIYRIRREAVEAVEHTSFRGREKRTPEQEKRDQSADHPSGVILRTPYGSGQTVKERMVTVSDDLKRPMCRYTGCHYDPRENCFNCIVGSKSLREG